MEPMLHPVANALRLLSLGRTKFYEEVHAGRITVIKAGKKTLVPHTSLQAYVDAKISEARAERAK
jgi:excisionase family DNA binding protein